MIFQCPNCASETISQKNTPRIVAIFREFFGDLETAEKETQDILQELCQLCGTLPEFVVFIEEQLEKGNKAIINEFTDNLHTPFLLQVGAPIFTFLLQQDDKAIQQLAIDAFGEFGALDDLGRFVLSNINTDIQIMGLRALEKIAKQYKKRDLPFEWKEYLDYIIGEREEVVEQLFEQIKKPGFLKENTISQIEPILLLKLTNNQVEKANE